MASTWDSEKWLLDNYNDKNGIPGFFVTGGYKLQHREIAEDEFRKTVSIIANNNEVSDAKEWAEKTIKSNYLCLELDNACTYWDVTLGSEIENSKNQQARQQIFRYTSSSDIERVYYKSKGKKACQESTSSAVPSSLRRRIEVDETNAYASIIRTDATNKLERCSTLNLRARHFIVCGMNNVLDLTDTKPESHLHLLSKEQQEECILHISQPGQYTHLEDSLLNDDSTKTMCNQKNWQFILKKTYSKLAAASDKDYPMLRLEQYLRYPENFKPEVLDRFSESSMIIKFWGPIIEATFCGSKLITNWGDTISFGPEKTNRKMDLRVIYGLTDSNDLANGEFGKIPSEAKYFHDKAKLVINGKSQLNNIIKATNDPSIELALLLVQGLQAELFKLSLSHDGLYELVNIKTFQFPKLTSFHEDVKRLIDGCSFLRSICIDSQIKYDAAVVKKMNKMDSFTKEVKENDFSLWLRPVWQPPPCNS
ncbi:hypothetical protein INT48_000626 [Thamnidium elegans]|uniref:Uncharacterized protein n=1 Tax=Thamnidium elegans TaxID=101142 RepID=A0A8H7SJ64_9FUNG|nr:hypothetical protein INT48_000626 [Thamnidium elegans]